MYLPIPPQPDCASAWREAVRLVDMAPKHSAYNVIIDITDPAANSTLKHPGIATVDNFLAKQAKPIETVANTIFPASLYHRHGAPDFFEVFNKRILPRVRRNGRWSGYYFERMINYSVPDGHPPNQLWDIVERMRNAKVSALNKFELSLFDPVRDVDNSPYGGQCLSFMSFKIIPGATRKLTLTVQYRNHYYIEKLLGNLIGLGRLMTFVSGEAGLSLGPLTVVSTHAVIDRPNKVKRAEIKALMTQFDQAMAPPVS
jgi:hypothetical protein